MSALFSDNTIVKYQDAIKVDNGAETVCNHEGGTSLLRDFI